MSKDSSRQHHRPPRELKDAIDDDPEHPKRYEEFLRTARDESY